MAFTEAIIKLPFRCHLILGFCIRLLLIIYGCFHDATFHVKYTDIDYRVFTDAARHVMKGESPYERHTYRYSPIIAWLLLPNVFLHEAFGKILFSISDILISICIRSYVYHQQNCLAKAEKMSKFCSLFWLYNPFSIAISTRGSADSVSCLFIMLSIYFLQTNNKMFLGNARYFLSGIFLGISIHLRLYPIVFCFPMYLSLGEYYNRINRSTTLKEGLIILIPNKRQIILALSTIAYFLACTYGMYLIYGYKFIFETYIYHLFRVDTRHNFSLFFYHTYLRMSYVGFDFLKFTSVLFVCVLLLLLSLSFGCDPLTLPFALFCQACVLVMYNSVVTSQYFIWYLSLLPLVVHSIRCTTKDAMYLLLMWGATQLSWLFYAYNLEFLDQEIYFLIWISGVMFFCSCGAVMYLIITWYSPSYALHTGHYGRCNHGAKDK